MSVARMRGESARYTASTLSRTRYWLGGSHVKAAADLLVGLSKGPIRDRHRSQGAFAGVNSHQAQYRYQWVLSRQKLERHSVIHSGP